jgi:hypothetical protein
MSDEHTHGEPIFSTLNRREAPRARAFDRAHWREREALKSAGNSRAPDMTKHARSALQSVARFIRVAPFDTRSLTALTLVTASLAVMGAGCVKRNQVPDAASLRAVEQESSSGVVAIATTMADSPTHITLCSGALVAPNLIVTARHCVSRATGTSTSGRTCAPV